MALPKKFTDRVMAHLKTFQAITYSHRTRDVSEADTVTVIKDMLAAIFGYDKYNELTSEQQIRGTYCDLAIKIEGKIRFLIEVKAAGADLTENHLRQAVNYGAHEGIEWVALTNSIDWRIYRIKFGQPVEHEQVACFNLGALSARNQDDLEKLFLLAREGLAADAISAFHAKVQLFNRFTVAQLLLSEPVAQAIRKELRRLFPDVKIEAEAITELLAADILKRDVVEGDKVKEAQALLKRTSQRQARATAKKGVVVDGAESEA